MQPSLRLLFPFCIAASSLAFAAPSADEPVIKTAALIVHDDRLHEANSIHLTLAELAPAATTSTGLADAVPNLFIASSGAHSFNDTLSLRGLTNTPIFGTPAVTVYLDDIPLGSSFTTPDSLAGFTSAHLLIGPGQNTLFGHAGPAGVLQLSTSESPPSSELHIGGGNLSTRLLSASVNTVSHTADFLTSIAHHARDGYLVNALHNHALDNRSSVSALARLRIKLTSTLSLAFLANATRAHDGEQPMQPLDGPWFTVSRQSVGTTQLASANAGLTATYVAPWGRLIATTSLNDWRLTPFRSVLAFGPDELFNDVTLTERNYHQEVKLSSAPDAALNWNGGLLATHGQTDGAFTRSFGPYVFEQSTYAITSRQFALFGQASTSLAPGVTLTAGLRAERVEKSIDRRELIPSAHVSSSVRTSSALLPKLACTYTPRKNTELSASLGSGYKPGGFSAFTGNRALAAFSPERTQAAEFSFTQKTPACALNTTLRVFAYSISGYQIERSFATSSVADDYLVINAPHARSVGSEIELTWAPLAHLDLTAQLGLTQVTLREFRDPYTGHNYAGRRAPYAPACDARFTTTYQHPSGWFISAHSTTNGRVYYTESESLDFAQRSYTLLGASLGFAHGPWQIKTYLENATDERFFSSISPGTGHGTPGQPRTYGGELTLHF